MRTKRRGMEISGFVWHTCTILSWLKGIVGPPLGSSHAATSNAVVGVLFLMAAGVSIGLGFGFTVDDALISTRVAHHLRTIGRYSFNAEGPVVDCVTPLGWAWLLAPFSNEGSWEGLEAARWLGALFALGSAWVLGGLVSHSPKARLSNSTSVGLGVVLATSLPFGAWASSGMETSLAMLLCTLGAWGFTRDHWAGAACAGLAGAIRPELLPWAATFSLFCPVVSTSTGCSANERMLRRLRRFGLVLIPSLVVVAIRVAVFGSPVPLALLAKPSDSSHGSMYVWGAVRLLGIPVLWLGWRTWRRMSSIGMAAGLSLLAHWISVLGVGGDWMSLFRLFVPVIPVGLWVGWLVLSRQSPWIAWGKVALACGINLLVLSSLGQTSRQIVQARRELVVEVSPLIQASQHIATLDVGWLGAATGATIIDLAGVTDPEIARLPGGHTSKRLPNNLLERRQVDTLVILLVPHHPQVSAGQLLGELVPSRRVEISLQHLEGAASFRAVGSLSLPGTAQRYVVLRREPTPAP